jgi:hypothetical protein
VGTLIVAAGGGGDAITAAALAGPLGLSEPPVVMTYSWDRLMVDPLPGPRSASDFTGLRELAPDVLEVLPSTEPIPPAGSSLPRLAADLPSRLLLLDPSKGAVGMATQISAAAEFFSADTIALVDVGGDVLTDGADHGLRSPLADQLTLAACVTTGLPVSLIIAAPGADGELPEQTVLHRLRELHAKRLPDLRDADFVRVREVFGWHPSEATGLLAAAAAGRRGCVEVRDAGDLIRLSDSTPSVYVISAEEVIERTPAVEIRTTCSLDEAERILRESTGISEIRYERRKASKLRDRRAHIPIHDDLKTIDRYAAEASARGADFISIRRLSELLGARSMPAFAALSALLRAERPSRCEPSIYRTRQHH